MQAHPRLWTTHLQLGQLRQHGWVRQAGEEGAHGGAHAGQLQRGVPRSRLTLVLRAGGPERAAMGQGWVRRGRRKEELAWWWHMCVGVCLFGVGVCRSRGGPTVGNASQARNPRTRLWRRRPAREAAARRRQAALTCSCCRRAATSASPHLARVRATSAPTTAATCPSSASLQAGGGARAGCRQAAGGGRGDPGR